LLEILKRGRTVGVTITARVNYYPITLTEVYYDAFTIARAKNGNLDFILSGRISGIILHLVLSSPRVFGLFP
jgi:hypothetical protein